MGKKIILKNSICFIIFFVIILVFAKGELMEIFGVFLLLIVVFVGLIIKLGIKIVSQADIYIIERLGRFHRVLDGGFHIIIPFFDSVRAKMSVRESLVDITKQQVITKDNVNIMVDGIVFLKVFDGKMALYNVEDYKRAISNLAMTTLRSAIGEMSLDSTLSSRDQLNAKLQIALGDAANNWGVKIMRVEISDISVPQDIEMAMNMQMKAEREKRAIELNAIAKKEALIRNAEALKQEKVLEAEAIERMADAKKYEQERIADASKYEQIVLADASKYEQIVLADASKYEQIALAQGQKEAMEKINEAASSSHAGLEFLLANERVKAFAELARNGENDKILVPYETSELIGSLSVFKEFLSTRAPKNSVGNLAENSVQNSIKNSIKNSTQNLTKNSTQNSTQEEYLKNSSEI